MEILIKNETPGILLLYRSIVSMRYMRQPWYCLMVAGCMTCRRTRYIKNKTNMKGTWIRNLKPERTEEKEMTTFYLATWSKGLMRFYAPKFLRKSRFASICNRSKPMIRLQIARRKVLWSILIFIILKYLFNTPRFP